MRLAAYAEEFLLTRLLRGVTVKGEKKPKEEKFLLTRLLRGVTAAAGRQPRRRGISTHTPLARRDDDVGVFVNSHFKFLLTRLLRGVTGTKAAVVKTATNFYSHASCEA